MKSCYIFDIDGTLANGDHRVHHIKKQPKDWDTYFSLCGEDEPIMPVVKLAQALWKSNNFFFYVSGRSDVCREQTEQWLMKHGLPKEPLMMRKQGDHRDDDILKSEFLDEILADGWIPLMVFDDRNRVVNMWRKRGIVCAQVAEGDF